MNRAAATCRNRPREARAGEATVCRRARRILECGAPLGTALVKPQPLTPAPDPSNAQHLACAQESIAAHSGAPHSTTWRTSSPRRALAPARIA